MKKQSNKKLAKELAARLDAGDLEPTGADSAEMQDLLALYACLDSVVEEPSPKLQRWVKRLLRESRFSGWIAAWVERFRARWLAWLPRRYHPALAGGVAVLMVLVLAMSIPSALGPGLDNSRARVPAGNEGRGYFAAVRSDSTIEDLARTVDAPEAPANPDESFAYEFETVDADGQVGYSDVGEVQDTLKVQPGAVSPVDAESSGERVGTEPHASDDGRMIVRRAAFTFVVQDTGTSFARVQEIAAESGGGIYSLESGKTPRGSLQTTVSIQVPVDACDQVLAQLRGMDAELLSEQVTSQDVTASYVDLDARVRNLELAEGELQELLEAARERGEKSQGILSIYDELVNIRQQIEQLKGQMTLLEHSAALARIDVALIPEEIAPEPAGFDAGRVLREAWEEVVRIFEDIAAFFIRAFAYAPLILPPLLVAALVVWLVVRRVRRRAAVSEDGEEA
jgi:hypothetical protein